VLTDLGFSEAFDSELRVPPISNIRSLEHVLNEVQLFSTREATRNAIRMLEKAGFGDRDDETSARLNIGIKKLLSLIEMSRQEPSSVAERLTGALMGLGM
jgi:vesicle-fusing ATPase